MDKIIDFFKTPEGFTGLIIFVFFLTLYIIAYKKSQRDEIVIINGRKDYITLIICLFSIPILIICLFSLVSSISLPFNDKAKLIICFLIFIIPIILTVYYSIISNNGNSKNILISISAKLFILLIFILVFLIRAMEIFNASIDENKDRRFKDGTKGNLILAAHNRNKRFTDKFIKNFIK